MEQRELTIKYEGNLKGIDATVLLPSLLGFVELIQEINREIHPKSKINIIIKSTEQGSFLVDLNLVLDALQKIKSLFGEHLSIDRIIEALTKLINIKKILKGKHPDRIEKKNGKVEIYINNSKFIIAEKIFIISETNARVDKAIAKMVEPILEDEKIDGILLMKDKDPVIKIPKEEIPYLIATNPLLKEDTRKIVYERQILYPVKIVFAPNRKWEFIWKGEKISALIKDESFYKRLGEISFKEGTKMIVDLEIEQVFDHELNDYVNREYFITKVYEVINPPELPSLF